MFARDVDGKGKGGRDIKKRRGWKGGFGSNLLPGRRGVGGRFGLEGSWNRVRLSFSFLDLVVVLVLTGAGYVYSLSLILMRGGIPMLGCYCYLSYGPVSGSTQQ